ncbi:MAG: hypothetical protein ACRCX2_28740 [Paraclostridium sp.]
MFRITGRFAKVWKVKEVKEKFVKVDLGTSDKQQDGSYKNSNWFNVTFFGKALEGAKTLQEGDKIEIISGKIENVFVKDKNQSYVNVVVFEFRLEEDSIKAVENTDEFPF